MKIEFDANFAHLLSDFCLDIAKAAFVAAFITPIIDPKTLGVAVITLTRGVFSATIMLLLAWAFSHLEEKL